MRMLDQQAAFERVGLVMPRVLDHVIQVRECACGGRLRADIRFPSEGVRRHNRTKIHQAYRARVIAWLES